MHAVDGAGRGSKTRGGGPSRRYAGSGSMCSTCILLFRNHTYCMVMLNWQSLCKSQENTEVMALYGKTLSAVGFVAVYRRHACGPERSDIMFASYLYLALTLSLCYKCSIVQLLEKPQHYTRLNMRIYRSDNSPPLNPSLLAYWREVTHMLYLLFIVSLSHTVYKLPCRTHASRACGYLQCCAIPFLSYICCLACNVGHARQWLGGWLYPQPTRVQTPGLTSVCLVKAEYSFSGRRRFRW
jgi:hypothetical protein